MGHDKVCEGRMVHSLGMCGCVISTAPVVHTFPCGSQPSNHTLCIWSAQSHAAHGLVPVLVLLQSLVLLWW